MNIDELDKELYRLTDSEKCYIKQQYKDYNLKGQSLLFNNQDVLQFTLKKMMKETNGKSFYIRKQSRFAPVPLHITDVIELNFVYSGNSTQYINGNKIILNEGDLILIDTQASHEVSSANYKDLILSINVEQNFFREYFFNHLQNQSSLTRFLFQAISNSQNHNQYLLFRNQNSSNLKLLFQQLFCEIYEPRLLDYDYKIHLVQLIFLELIRSFSVEANGTYEDSHKQQLALEILSYINSHYAETNLETCALYFGYNSSYFSTLVKDYTGKTFKNILQEKRLEASLPLLLHSKESIRNISLDVGFSNLNHYYKLFKTAYGLTPAEYRKKQATSSD